MRDFDDDLLGPGPIREFRIDLTTRCNLRCVYCLVSQPDYVGHDMNPDIAAKAVAAVEQVAVYSDIEYVSVAGHGETTYMDGWVDVVDPIIDTGLRVTITSNLAKEYSDRELSVLGRLHAIAVSIDTCDRDLLRRMRRRVDVRQIVTNINLIRAAALDRPPAIYFLSGLYDQNSLHLEAFARFAVALRVGAMNFWDLSKYDYERAQIPLRDRPLPLDELSEDELRLRLQCIAKGFEILREHNIPINVHGNWIDRLAAKVDMHV